MATEKKADETALKSDKTQQGVQLQEFQSHFIPLWRDDQQNLLEHRELHSAELAQFLKRMKKQETGKKQNVAQKKSSFNRPRLHRRTQRQSCRSPCTVRPSAGLAVLQVVNPHESTALLHQRHAQDRMRTQPQIPPRRIGCPDIVAHNHRYYMNS